MFFANSIERLREGGRLCLITNDSFRTLTTHSALRRYILDRCKIVEILLTDTKHFQGVSFQFAGMAITTSSDAPTRRLVGRTRCGSSTTSEILRTSPLRRRRRSRSCARRSTKPCPRRPLVGVPREVLEAAKASERVADVARGRQGLATADDSRFLAAADDPRVRQAGVAAITTDEEQHKGISPSKPYWIAFAEGGRFGEYVQRLETVIDLALGVGCRARAAGRAPARDPAEDVLPQSGSLLQAGTHLLGRLERPDLGPPTPGGLDLRAQGKRDLRRGREPERALPACLPQLCLATYFLKKLVNATATADVGYIESCPTGAQRRRSKRQSSIASSKSSPRSRPTRRRRRTARTEIDDRIFDLFKEVEDPVVDLRYPTRSTSLAGSAWSAVTICSNGCSFDLRRWAPVGPSM